MKNVFVALVVLFALVVPASAQSPSYWVGIKSQYVTVNAIQAYDKPVMQGNAFLPIRNGYYANLWLSQSLDGENNEIDYTLGWASDNVDVSLGFFDLQPVGESGDMFYPAVKLLTTKVAGKSSIVPYVVAEYALALEDAKENSGLLLRVGADVSRPLTSTLSLSHGGWVMWEEGIFRGDPGYSLRYEAGVGVKRGAYTLQPMVQASVPFNMSDKETQVILVLRVLR